MARKNERSRIVNNIHELNLEIDYDKLAESIVKAQNKSKTQSVTKSTSKFRSAAMNFFNGAIFSIVYVFSLLSIYVIWTELYSKGDTSFLSCAILTIIMLFVGIYAFLCQQESILDREKDAHEHFNTNISLLALIVAIIALFKVVG